jgi:hypothetical protein
MKKKTFESLLTSPFNKKYFKKNPSDLIFKKSVNIYRQLNFSENSFKKFENKELNDYFKIDSKTYESIKRFDGK